MKSFKSRRIERNSDLEGIDLSTFNILLIKEDVVPVSEKPKLKYQRIKDEIVLDESFNFIMRPPEQTVFEPSELTGYYELIRYKGDRGQDGQNGVDGWHGKDGINGKDGRDGIDGINGVDGKDGEDGKDGKDGFNGEQGIPGINGVDGINGIDGKDGRDGIDGINGEPGPAGQDGKDGIDGKDGRDGIDGLDGMPGVDGKDGINGKDGRDGKDGKDGLNGIDGINGIDGKPGKDGKTGPKGKDGKDGRDGIDGMDGAVGPAGRDGKDGKDGQDGKRGPKGNPGKDGVDGKDGKDGTVPAHETIKNMVRFANPDGTFGNWLDLSKGLTKPRNNGADYPMGGGGSNVDVIYGDTTFKPLAINFDSESILITDHGKGVITIGVNPAYIPPVAPSSGGYIYSWTYDYFKLQSDGDTVFTLKHLPVWNSETVILNGLVLTLGMDYDVDGNIIIINDAHNTKANWNLTVKYSFLPITGVGVNEVILNPPATGANDIIIDEGPNEVLPFLEIGSTFKIKE